MVAGAPRCPDRDRSIRAPVGAAPDYLGTGAVRTPLKDTEFAVAPLLCCVGDTDFTNEIFGGATTWSTSTWLATSCGAPELCGGNGDKTYARPCASWMGCAGGLAGDELASPVAGFIAATFGALAFPVTEATSSSVSATIE